MRRRVVVTGIGILAPNAIGVSDFAEAIFSGKSGIGTISLFDATALNYNIAAEVKNFDPASYMSVSVARKTDRFAQLGIAAASMALEDARIRTKSSDLLKAIVIIGSGLGGLNFHEQMMLNFLRTQNYKDIAASSVPRITPNAVSAYIAMEHQIKGSNQVISTACSSSAMAIGEAFTRVREGKSDIALSGGVEATISELNIAMYKAMMVLGTSLTANIQEASRPFDKTRNGFVMGEGSACLVLEELDHAKARGATIYAEIAGFASNCGAYHMVAPDPSGLDASEVMKQALNDAKLNESNLDYISAHGTSTKLNDMAETKAIKNLLGDRAKLVPISSIKSMIGHTIGASGAIQAAASCLALVHDCLPPTINLNIPDPECDLDYVPHKSRKVMVTTVLSNSFGFGSNNVALVFKKADIGS